MKRLALLLLLAPLSSAATSFDVVVPNQTTTGVAFNLTVTAKNGSSVDTGYSGTIHFSSSETTATLPSDYTFVPADNGTHTFSATFNHSDPWYTHALYTFSARDTANNSITGTDLSDVYWNTNVFRRMKVEAPETATRTVPFDATISAVNAYGTVLTSYTGTVHFRGTSGMVLPPDYAFTPADNGAHTFSFTSNDGSYNAITAEDAGDPVTGMSDSFDVACPELIVNAGNTGPVCPDGGTTTLYASSNQTGVEYYWSGPRIFSAMGDTATAYRAGMYFAHATQTANRCTMTVPTEVQMKTVAQPAITASPQALCAGQHFTVSVANGASFSNYQWTVDYAQLVSGQGTPSIDVLTGANLSNGTIWATFHATDNATGCEVQGGKSVLIGEPIDAHIDAPTSVCPNTTNDAVVIVPGATTFDWTITNGTITAGLGSNMIQWKPTGIGDVQLNVTVANAACSDVATATIPVHGPTAHVGGDFAVCAGEEASIPVSLAGTPPFTIHWSDGVTQENIDSMSTTRTITATESATYSIALVTDAICSGTASGDAEVVVQDEPRITEQPHGGGISRGDRVTLFVHADGENLRYDWYQGRAGERTHLVQSGPSSSYMTTQLQETTRFWVDVVSSCGASQSHTATLSISNRHRSARH